MDGFTFLCKKNELPEKRGKKFIVNETEIAVFKIDGEIFALDNICPHQHSAIIYDGFLEDGFVVCPAHGWKFNLKTGNKDDGNRGLKKYDVIIDEENIYINVENPENSFGAKFKW